MSFTLYRGLAFLIAIAGTMISNQLYLLIVGLLFVLILLSIQGKLIEFAKFGLTTLLPVGGILIVIWGFIRQGGPGMEKSLESGIQFAILTTLRLALLAGIFLAAVLTLAPEQLIHLFRTFGIRGRALAVVLSCLNLWSDFQLYIRQVYVSRCARGLMPNRRFVTRLRQFPHTVRALFISTLIHTIDRANAWENDGLIERLDNFNKNPSALQGHSPLKGPLLLALSMVWTITTALCFFCS